MAAAFHSAFEQQRTFHSAFLNARFLRLAPPLSKPGPLLSKINGVCLLCPSLLKEVWIDGNVVFRGKLWTELEGEL